jgi:hypothetical protein
MQTYKGDRSKESLGYGQAINGGALHANGYTDRHAGSFESGYQAGLEAEGDFEEHQRRQRRRSQRGDRRTAGSHQEHKCQSGEMLNCLTFYLDGGMYTFLYPLDARHPNPPQSPLGSGILIG